MDSIGICLQQASSQGFVSTKFPLSALLTFSSFTAVWHLWHHGGTFTEAHELDGGSPGQRRNQIGFIKNFKAVEIPESSFKRGSPTIRRARGHGYSYRGARYDTVYLAVEWTVRDSGTTSTPCRRDTYGPHTSVRVFTALC
jgi:hypothetical protein